MRYAPILAALTILPLLGCLNDGSLDVTSPGSESSTSDQRPVAVERPFKGHMVTTFGQPGSGDPGFSCDGDPATPASLIEGSGTATHLGATTYVSDSEIVFSPNVQCGRGTFVSAQGGEVHFEYVGPFTFNPANGNITFAGEWSVTGGTGRFDGVTGGGTYEGGANAFVQQGEVSFLGTLVY